MAGSGALTEPRLERDVPLAPFTTFGIGGPADLLARPRTPDELADVLRWARAEGIDWFLLGLGANILVGDRGFRGLVIKNEAQGFSFDRDGRLTAGSGAVVADLIEHSCEEGLSGLEHYQDIPSTVGGALWQNLHFLSWPHERTHFVEEVLESARILLPDGDVIEVGVDWFEFGYDDSRLHHSDEVVLEATFALERKDAKRGPVHARHERALARREAPARRGPDERRLDLPEAGGNRSRPPDRRRRPEGPPHRRRRGERPPRELHPERRSRISGGRTRLDSARPRHGGGGLGTSPAPGDRIVGEF